MILALVTCLAGCDRDTIDNVAFSLTAYGGVPVMVTDLRVDGQMLGQYPAVVAGQADTRTPRSGGKAETLVWPGGTGRIAIRAEWSEILTGRAWLAMMSIDTEDLNSATPGTVDLGVILGPNGLFILTSGPAPAKGAPHDVVRQCGRRQPSRDTDFTADTRAVAGLQKALSQPHPPIATPTECPDV